MVRLPGEQHHRYGAGVLRARTCSGPAARAADPGPGPVPVRHRGRRRHAEAGHHGPRRRGVGLPGSGRGHRTGRDHLQLRVLRGGRRPRGGPPRAAGGRRRRDRPLPGQGSPAGGARRPRGPGARLDGGRRRDRGGAGGRRHRVSGGAQAGERLGVQRRTAVPSTGPRPGMGPRAVRPGDGRTGQHGAGPRPGGSGRRRAGVLRRDLRRRGRHRRRQAHRSRTALRGDGPRHPGPPGPRGDRRNRRHRAGGPQGPGARLGRCRHRDPPVRRRPRRHRGQPQARRRHDPRRRAGRDRHGPGGRRDRPGSWAWTRRPRRRSRKPGPATPPCGS
ncbi:hypothetical protein STENM327S_08623 [Streptomyces tendae]